LVAPFQVKYMDEDQDMITITSDLELKESVNVASVTQSSLGSPVLRLFVFGPQTKKETAQVPQPATKENAPAEQANPFGMFSNLQMLNDPQMVQNLLGQLFGQLNQEGTATVQDVTALFQNLGLNPNQPGEAKTDSPQQQFQQGVAALLNNPLLKELLPQFLSNFNQTPTASSDASDASDVHPGVVCDGCGNGISGIR